MRRNLIWILPLAAACGETGVELERCGPISGAPQCVQRDNGPCGAGVLVDAVCQGNLWECAAPATVYQPPATLTCAVPYADTAPVTIGPGIAIGGSCNTLLGSTVGDLNEAVQHQRALASSDSCSAPVTPTAPVLDRGSLADDIVVDVTDTFQVGARTYVLYRLFRRSDEQLFGVEPLFGGVVEAAPNGTYRPTEQPFFEDDWFRTATVRDGIVNLLVCGGEPEVLTYRCVASRVATNRVMDPTAYTYFDGRDWIGDVDSGAEVQRSGPQASLRYHPGLDEWILASAFGFGRDIHVSRAKKLTGPWSTPQDIVHCELPAEDPDAFCHSVFLRPDLEVLGDAPQVVLTYAVESLAPDRADRRRAQPLSYGARVFRTSYVSYR